MAGYGWTYYDAMRGGMQIINDTKLNIDLINNFVKIMDDEHHSGWGLRVTGFSRTKVQEHERKAAIFYLGSEDPNSKIKCEHANNVGSDSDVICSGMANGLGRFTMEIRRHLVTKNSSERLSIQSLDAPVDSIWQAKSIFTNKFEGNDS
jgi:hypothetical protein